MLISSKGRYALRLMIYIAALGDTEGKIALREVADREHISVALVDIADERTEEYSLYGTGVLRHLTDGGNHFVH